MLFKDLANSVNPSGLILIEADPQLCLDHRFLKRSTFIVKSLVNMHEPKLCVGVKLYVSFTAYET